MTLELIERAWTRCDAFVRTNRGVVDQVTGARPGLARELSITTRTHALRRRHAPTLVLRFAF
jgi:hypothetical protein